MIKNKIKKKSLNGRTFELISMLNSETERIIPASNAPISIENPSKLNAAATEKHQHTENKNNNSCDFAADFANRGIKKKPTKNNPTTRIAP